MFDLTTFLTRWLYLSNLVRDRAEIQTLPYKPRQSPNIESHVSHHSQSQADQDLRPSGEIPRSHPATHPSHWRSTEEEWRDQCLQGLLSYPQGTQRLLAMDSLRVELVQKLAQQLRISDEIMRELSASCHKQRQTTQKSVDNRDDDEDPYLDADTEIVRAFGQATIMDENAVQHLDDAREQHEAVLVISRNGTDIVQKVTDVEIASESIQNQNTKTREKADIVTTDVTLIPTSQDVEDAHTMFKQLRAYLPQLVSAVLHSPPALSNIQGLDATQKLRRLILTRCLQDPSWGIELCWLLEAEVGRTWKTLFEHRQQTGKRLIVVLPAERAAALAKIGMEKQGAFNLLQDAEQATAYGYMLPSMNPLTHGDQHMIPMPPPLPSSLSMRRCSHFGDTMHFIDRLTQISLELRVIPAQQRHNYLIDALSETNRRLRRRMVTRGDVSLDVEDYRGPYDWPGISDLSSDMLRYSVHFPLEPVNGTWPGRNEGDFADRTGEGVMRVLNIVATESRILASRARCPYLILLEVADTQLDGGDARLYASGTNDVGTTIEEALGLGTSASARATSGSSPDRYYGGFPEVRIPPELLSHDGQCLSTAHNVIEAEYNHSSSEDRFLDRTDGARDDPRGGWQADEGAFFRDEGPDYLFTNPYDTVRQEEYEQLHAQMQIQPRQVASPEIQVSMSQRPPLSMMSALLERVYGLAWTDKCRKIREASAFGHVEGWRLASFIMKAGEDIRREALVMQIISKLNDWFQSDIPKSHRPYLRPYRIMCVGGDAGLIECVNDAKSLDEVKKRTDGFTTLRDYFERAYGPPYHRSNMAKVPYGPTDITSDITFETAQDNFLRSLVGYSLVCYILQIKDRHNANILLGRQGHILHIDFGFVLGDTPKMGRVPLFSERAPFKLNAELWDVLGGWNFHEGGLGVKFCKMFEIAFSCAAAHADEIAISVEAAILNIIRDPNEARVIANGIRSRLSMRGPPGSNDQKSFIVELVNSCLTDWGASTYDWLQKSMNGYQ